MWLGERITDYGVGNGQSMIIFVGIIATAGQAIVNKFAEIPSNLDAIWELVAFVLVCVVIFFCNRVRGFVRKKSSRTVCQADQG